MSRPLVWIYTIAGVQYLPLHDLLELEVEDRLGSVESLTFTFRADDPKAFAVIPDVLVSYDDRLYRIEELVQTRQGSRVMTQAYCEARWMDLGKRVRAGSFSALGVTALAGLTSILSGSGWTAAVSPADVALYSMEDLDASLLALVKRWAGIVGREIEFDTDARTVTLVEAIGEDRGIGFRYGHNLRSVERRYRPPVATKLFAFGANDLDISNSEPSGLTYVEDFSWYTAQGLTLLQARAEFTKDQVWIDPRFLLSLNLYDAAVRRLAALAQPTISYELSVSDFSSLTGSTADDVALGDTVRVRDAAFLVDVQTRVVRLVRRPLEPETNEIELSYLQPGLADVEDSNTSRSIDYGETAILVDTNDAVASITSVTNELAVIQATSTGEATFVLGATVKGTTSGAGTVRFSFAIDGVDQVPTYDFAFTTGTQLEFSWPTFATGVDASSTVQLSWRARIVSGVGTISVAIGEAKAWALTRGAVGIGVNNSPNQSLFETLELVTLPALDDAAIVEIISPVDLTEDETLATYSATLDDDTASAPVVTIT